MALRRLSDRRFRLLIVLFGLGAFALGCYDLANPYRFGQIGFDGPALNNGNVVFAKIYPGGPAEKAGIRSGDIFEKNRLGAAEHFNLDNRRAGQTLRVPVLRGGKHLVFYVTTNRAENLRPLEQEGLQFGLLILFVATGILVAVRGASRVDVRSLSVLVIAWAWDHALQGLGNVAPTPALAFIGADTGFGGGAPLARGVVNYALLVFAGNFPPVRSSVRAAVSRSAVPITILWLVVCGWIDARELGQYWIMPHVFGMAVPQFAHIALMLAVSLLVIAAAVDGLLHADEEHRTQMRWVGSALILSSGVGLTESQLFLPSLQANSVLLSSNLRTILTDVPMLAIAYTILRHRMVDLTIVISRAAIFSFVSAALVALFVAGEWAATQLLERGIGPRAVNGLAGQALTLAVALGVGLSARSIHGNVESSLNRLFFKKRALSLAALHRFSLESEIITTLDSLLSLAFDCVHRNVESHYTAIYICESGPYRRVFGPESTPALLSVDDAEILRLRRWSEPFTVERGRQPFSEALLLPMTARGQLLGVFVCGPKRERTPYLQEEIEALALLAQRVGTAYQFLQLDAQRRVLA